MREQPSTELRHCLARDVPTVRPDIVDRAVFEEFASYDMMAMFVMGFTSFAQCHLILR